MVADYQARGWGWWRRARCSGAASRRWSEAQGARTAVVVQGEKNPSRVDAGDGNDQQVDAGRNGMPRVVGEMRDCGGMDGVGWLQMRTHASCVLCLLARDRKFRRSSSERQAGDHGGWLARPTTSKVSHIAATALQYNEAHAYTSPSLCALLLGTTRIFARVWTGPVFTAAS